MGGWRDDFATRARFPERVGILEGSLLLCVTKCERSGLSVVDMFIFRTTLITC